MYDSVFVYEICFICFVCLFVWCESVVFVYYRLGINIDFVFLDFLKFGILVVILYCKLLIILEVMDGVEVILKIFLFCLFVDILEEGIVLFDFVFVMVFVIGIMYFFNVIV